MLRITQGAGRATALLLRILIGPLWEVMGEKGSIPPYNQEHKTDCKRMETNVFDNF